ncbi:MAG TPA: prepilin-type N-terminal cleavage/methylation domain-containing protein [Noviherbaspirillum sp.]
MKPRNVTFPKRLGGFTLMEAIIVIVITGIIAAIVAVFIRKPVDGYLDAARRAELTDAADTALRRIARDLHLALPNSVRVTSSGTVMEFLLTRNGGRYRYAPEPDGSGNVLDTTTNVTSFDVLGPSVTLYAGDQIVVFNLGFDDADAYSGSNLRAYSGAGETTTTVPITSTTPFPRHSPSHRFHIVSGPVTYICDNGSLWRYWGYAIQPLNANTNTVAKLDALVSPATSTRGKALLVQNVDCANTFFTYTGGVTESSGLVAMQLALKQNGESVTLYHEVHVNNAP